MEFIKHRECNAELGVPDELAHKVRPLPVRVDEVSRTMTSFWRLDPEERRALSAGAVVCLSVVGSHPPVKIGVFENDQDGVTEVIGLQEAKIIDLEATLSGQAELVQQLLEDLQKADPGAAAVYHGGKVPAVLERKHFFALQELSAMGEELRFWNPELQELFEYLKLRTHSVNGGRKPS